MNTDDPIDWFKLTAYFAGECTAEERDALEQWLQAAPERRRQLDRLRVVWASRHHRPTLEYGREGVVAHIMAMIQQGQGKGIALPQTERRPTRRSLDQALPWRVWPSLGWLTLGAAAIVAAWTLGGVSHRGVRALSPLEYTTENGERAHITLPDGNTVSLDVGSRLDVPADYATGNHVVRLVGEALFDVSHRSGTPFTVVAGAATARVLGTSFVVRHYRTDTTTMVAVRDGKVAVGSTVATAQGLITVGEHGVARGGVADPSLFSFATGVLALDSTRLSEAIPELNRWYNVDIRLGDPTLVGQPIDGRFTAGSVAGLVEILEGTYDIHVVRSGRVLTLYTGSKR